MLALVVLPFGCRPDAGTAVPEGPPAAAWTVDEPTPTTPTEPPPGEPGEPAEPPPVYRFAWGHTTGDWNAAVAVAPAGWVVSASGRTLRVHASDDGRVLETARICSLADNGVAITSDTEGIVVCDDGEIRALAFPGLAQRPVAKIGGELEVVGWGGGLVAAGARNGRVYVVDTRTWTALEGFSVPHEVEGVAVAPDGRWVAAGDDEGDTVVWDVATKTMRTLASTDRRPTAMAASPDGTRLFVQDGSFEARVYALSDATIVAAHECGSWLTGARWLSPELVAATGSNGMVLYATGRPEGQPLVDPDAERHASYEWLGASPDGAIVCGGDRDGRISCFSTASMPASTYAPAPAVAEHTGPARGDAGGGEPAAAAGPLLQGSIASRKGKRLTITPAGAELPAVGTKGELSRRFERQLGRMTMSGWMSIATVEVTRASPTAVELQILEETANVTVNGRKQNQFKAGFEVKLEPGS